MSEWKRSNSEYGLQRQQAERPPRAIDLETGAAFEFAGIEDSQPRPTLDMSLALDKIEAAEPLGGDPYNSVGSRIRAGRAA
ncbi:MAG: hypothetical protein RML32_02460 [Gammaproteobacteria bacterium]|nr:hypothetical protein [Gammaproteobacteria bacterium]